MKKNKKVFVSHILKIWHTKNKWLHVSNISLTITILHIIAICNMNRRNINRERLNL